MPTYSGASQWAACPRPQGCLESQRMDVPHKFECGAPPVGAQGGPIKSQPRARVLWRLNQPAML